jgi:murein DD-endopeptidase MepM/ murein hydrolase activator NlpD
MRRWRGAGASLALLVLLACAGTPEEDAVVHVLRPGENLYRLSRHYGVSVQAIMRANDIDDVTDLPTGARIVIPGAQHGPPSTSLAAYVPSVPGAPDARALGLAFAWPVHGKLSSRYGWRHGSHHEGIDISARPGTPVRAAEAGRVVFSGRLGGYGQLVIVKHAGAYSTVYAHNRRNHVEKGQFVERGELLAEVGTTGNASGPHLHFEVRRDRAPEDPMGYLP